MRSVARNNLSAIFATPAGDKIELEFCMLFGTFLLHQPCDFRFRISPRFAHQFRWASLGHHHIARCFFIDYIRRNHYLQKCSLPIRVGTMQSMLKIYFSLFIVGSSMLTHGTHLHFHGIGIHLAHVLATVLHSNVSYDQCPCVVIVVCHRQPIAVRDDVFVYRQNGLCIGFYPRNLNHSTHIFRTCACLCGCVRYLCNGRMRCECVWETISRVQRKSALEKKQNRNITSGNGCFRSVETFCLLNTFALTFFWNGTCFLSRFLPRLNLIKCKKCEQQARAPRRIIYISFWFMEFWAFSFVPLSIYANVFSGRRPKMFTFTYWSKYELHVEKTQIQTQ